MDNYEYNCTHTVKCTPGTIPSVSLDLLMWFNSGNDSIEEPGLTVGYNYTSFFRMLVEDNNIINL